MKKNDIAIIVLIVSMTLVASYLVLHAVVGNPSEHTQAVEKAPVISSEVPEPDTAIFNEDAIDPAVSIEIGNPSNQQPFQ